IFLTLSVAGLSSYAFSWKIGIVVAVVMLTVVASYRQNVHAYPSGGGDYEVATVNIGPTAGLTVASALLVDYVLTVAVSISSGVQNAASALTFLRGHEAIYAALLVLLLMTINLRGVRESGTAFAIPTYGFMFGVLLMAGYGFYRYYLGHNLPMAESSGLSFKTSSSFSGGFTGIAASFLILRAFSSGCAALTGVEAISNGVPAFRSPKSKNAATTLLLLGTLAVTMLMSVIVLANLMHMRVAEFPGTQLLRNGVPVGNTYTQETVMAQLARAVFDHFPVGFYYITAVTGLILVLAANTAFNGFPVLASILAQDKWLPRQLQNRGDRLAYSNGIIILALAAVFLIIAFDAQVTRLIQLYIVGVFVSFNMSQFGMIRHWNRNLKLEQDPSVRRRMIRSRAINAFGLCMTATVLVVVLLTKFTKGAYMAILAMGVLFVLMKGIRRHYNNVARELAVAEDEPQLLPARTHVVVLVSKIDRPTMRAIAYARATRPTTLEALVVDVDPKETSLLVAEWERRAIPVPLRILASPFREITKPIIDHVRMIRREGPRDLVTVFIPEYVLGHWWEQLLHNQSALRLKARLRFSPGVMVTSVPWQLASSEAVLERADQPIVSIRDWRARSQSDEK
ncbi:MAG TPA: APC family permease, partial [Candidatus Nanopelagicaceae bacterium]|nr:APC family permease [Candidatus Nanopelagicaceae bacterium]